MSEKYKMNNVDGVYFLTLTVVDWIDLFTIYAWCIMPSHIHLIVASNKFKLSDILRDFKKYTSKMIIKEMDLINESRRE